MGNKITVYRYRVLDAYNATPRIARRWGTRAAINAMKDQATLLEDTGVEVDDSVIGTNGLTPLDFDPKSSR